MLDRRYHLRRYRSELVEAYLELMKKWPRLEESLLAGRVVALRLAEVIGQGSYQYLST